MSIKNNKKLKLWELDRLSEEEFKSQVKNPLIVILDDIRSLNNIGSFFRTADAFNIEKEHKIIKSPSGATCNRSCLRHSKQNLFSTNSSSLWDLLRNMS